MFTKAPVLLHPDPAQQFVVEVDASDSGVGAVLSQRSAADKKLHPCAFLSRRLTPAERNYDMGNPKLLAVVLALQEWRHWLEGASHPFVIWTDHKNLSYPRTARQLNSRQCRWALFLGCFRFTLTYRSGAKNVTAAEMILPSRCVVGALRWQVEREVQEALRDQLVPDECPPGQLFVPHAARSSVFTWGHASRIVCHPGIHRNAGTAAFLVAIHGGRRQNLRHGMHRMCPEQGHASPSSRTSAATVHPITSLVAHCCGLRHRPAPVRS